MRNFFRDSPATGRMHLKDQTVGRALGGGSLCHARCRSAFPRGRRGQRMQPPSRGGKIKCRHVTSVGAQLSLTSLAVDFTILVWFKHIISAPSSAGRFRFHDGIRPSRYSYRVVDGDRLHFLTIPVFAESSGIDARSFDTAGKGAGVRRGDGPFLHSGGKWIQRETLLTNSYVVTAILAGLGS